MKDQLQEFGKLLPGKEISHEEKLMIALCLLLIMLTFSRLMIHTLLAAL